jgi:hypothetical protein
MARFVAGRREPAERAERGWGGRLDRPAVLRLLDEPGCVLCRIRDKSDEVWLWPGGPADRGDVFADRGSVGEPERGRALSAGE